MTWKSSVYLLTQQSVDKPPICTDYLELKNRELVKCLARTVFGLVDHMFLNMASLIVCLFTRFYYMLYLRVELAFAL